MTNDLGFPFFCQAPFTAALVAEIGSTQKQMFRSRRLVPVPFFLSLSLCVCVCRIAARC